MYGDKDSARGNCPCHFGSETGFSTTRSHFHPVVILNTQIRSITRMNFQERLGMHLPNFLNFPGTRLGVPVPIKPTIGQDEGIFWIGWFSQSS